MGVIAGKPDVDLTDGQFFADGGARAAYRWMRAHEPVFRDRNGQAAAATYQAVLDAERNPEGFSSTGGIRPDQPAMPYMIDMDDPAHLVRRKLVNAGFTRKRVSDQAAGIATLCDVLIDAVCERGECDFVRDLAAPLPMAVIGDMLGVLPQDRATLLKWSDDLVCGLSATADEAALQAVMDAFAGYSAFAMQTTAQRRAQPTDDLFSILVNAEVEGQRMSDDEIVFETLLILIGGDETTRHTLSGGTEQLLRHPDQLARLRADPGLVGNAVEELLRYDAPVQFSRRITRTDVTVGDVTIPAGSFVFTVLGAANRDPAHFGPDADRLDLGRTLAPQHLAFGGGIHHCLGAVLARAEARAAIGGLVRRFPRLAPTDAPPDWNGRLVLRGLESLPVTC